MGPSQKRKRRSLKNPKKLLTTKKLLKRSRKWRLKKPPLKAQRRRKRRRSPLNKFWKTDEKILMKKSRFRIYKSILEFSTFVRNFEFLDNKKKPSLTSKPVPE